MKKIYNQLRIIGLFILIGIPMPCIKAQIAPIVTSVVDTVGSANSIFGDKEIVRCANNRYLVTYSHNASNSGAEHKFIVRDLQTNSIKVFNMNAESSGSGIYNIYGPILYTINDMCVVDDTCFFCGSRRKPTGYIYGIDGSIIGTVVDTVGVIGRFTIPEVLSSGGTYSIIQICAISVFDRMDAYYDHSCHHIYAVGHPKNGATDSYGNYLESRLMELDYNPRIAFDYAWSYSIVKPIDNDEQFTDVAFVNGKVVSVSKFSDGQCHCQIGLRNCKPGFFNDYIIDILNVMYEFSAVGMACKIDSVPILIDGSAYHGDFAVSYASENAIAHGISLFKFKLADFDAIEMVDRQFVGLGNNQIVLKDMKYLPILDNVVLLTHCLSTNQSRLSVGKFGVGSLYSEMINLGDANMVLQSLAVRNTNDLYMAGHENITNKILHVYQLRSRMSTSCLGRVSTDFYSADIVTPNLGNIVSRTHRSAEVPVEKINTYIFTPYATSKIQGCSEIVFR